MISVFIFGSSLAPRVNKVAGFKVAQTQNITLWPS